MIISDPTAKKVEHLCTADEAVKLINKRGTSVYICISRELPTVENGKQTGKAFPGFGVIRVTKRTAIQHVRDVLSGFESRGARIRISTQEADPAYPRTSVPSIWVG